MVTPVVAHFKTVIQQGDHHSHLQLQAQASPTLERFLQTHPAPLWEVLSARLWEVPLQHCPDDCQPRTTWHSLGNFLLPLAQLNNLAKQLLFLLPDSLVELHQLGVPTRHLLSLLCPGTQLLLIPVPNGQQPLPEHSALLLALPRCMLSSLHPTYSLQKGPTETLGSKTTHPLRHFLYRGLLNSRGALTLPRVRHHPGSDHLLQTFNL